jgi:hypothetical protein
VTHHRLDKCRYLIQLGQVVCDRQRIDALRRELRSGLLQFAGFTRADGDFRTHVRQPLGDLQAEASRAPGHQRHFAFEFEQIAHTH